MKLWIDDVRPAPDGWLWAKTSSEALFYFALSSIFNNMMEDDSSTIREISFDHDLGGDDTTRPVVNWLVENDCFPAVCHVHTSNPVGREWLVGMINRYGPGVVR